MLPVFYISVVTVLLSEMRKPAYRRSGDLIGRVLQILPSLLQLFPDGDALGTVSLTFAAFDAVGCGRRILPKGSTHQIFPETAEFAFSMIAVPGSEGTGYIHTLGAGHTIAAAGAADLHPRLNGLNHPF